MLNLMTYSGTISQKISDYGVYDAKNPSLIMTRLRYIWTSKTIGFLIQQNTEKFDLENMDMESSRKMEKRENGEKGKSGNEKISI